jgi:DNA repair protein RadA/Sms
MAKIKTQFECRECGSKSPKWLGKCPDCNAWSSFDEVKNEAGPVFRKNSTIASGTSPKKRGIKGKSLSEIKSEEASSYSTGISELDQVLGGGLVPGAMILVGGDPGIGKSTLLLQAVSSISSDFSQAQNPVGLTDQESKGKKVLYVSGEESEHQIKQRAERLGLKFGKGFYILSETSFENIYSAIDDLKPDVLVMDSIQTLYTETLTSAPGSVSQVREVSGLLLNLAKSTNTAVFLVGHVTKEGSIAGPRVLEHMVDTVLYFEGENSQNFRILRSIKNRFGSTHEVGLFDMKSDGLHPVKDPSGIFLTSGDKMPGTAVTTLLEGTRPIMNEVQALVTRTSFTYPKRTCLGFDQNRLSLLMAVIEKRMGIQILDQDVFLKVVGGMKIFEPAADLAVCAAIISSFRDKPVSGKTLFLGEVGLTGELRAVPRIQERVLEASRLGFTRVVFPSQNSKDLKNSDIRTFPIANLADVEDLLFDDGEPLFP